jgi:hypothetical protein
MFDDFSATHAAGMLFADDKVDSLDILKDIIISRI